MQNNNITSIDEYYDPLVRKRDKVLYIGFVNEITTNKTDFFWENAHFEFISILSNNPTIEETKKVRVWSAACSTSEEPYTLGITLLEQINF